MTRNALYTYAFILGSHPKLSVAELEALMPKASFDLRNGVAFLCGGEPIEPVTLMERLGGTIKIVEMLGAFDEERLTNWLFNRINPESKFNFGFSLYAIDSGIPVQKEWKVLQDMGLGLKRALKEDGISSRYVSSREVILSSVIVHKERLLKNGAEIDLFKGVNGELLYGVTRAVQPFQSFSKRDYGRPNRDHKSGMLPPKLARMMVNIAAPTKMMKIMDPFCGSGTILQEALLLGFDDVRGSDISKKAIMDTKKNLEWLEFRNIPLQAAAAEKLVKDGVVGAGSIDRIIFEGYLGEPKPRERDIQRISKELQEFYSRAFIELAKTLSFEGRMVCALPFWRIPGKKKEDVHLQIEPLLKKARLVMEREPLYYRREQSIVGREILVLKHD